MKVSEWKVVAGRSKLRLYISVMLGCIFLGSCAQVGPPLPPSLELPKPPTDLHASRKGNSVTLAWTEPMRTMDRRTIRYLGPTDICRTTETEMKECGPPVAVAPAPRGTSGRSTETKPQIQTYVDQLPEAVLEQNPGGELTYGVEVLNEDNRSAGLSNQARVPAVPTLSPPSDFAAQLTGDGVVLSWTTAGETSPLAGVTHRYRIYRHDEAGGKDAVAGEVAMEQAGTTRFLDSGFEWEHTYHYRVTVVSVASHDSSETQVEGDDSTPVRVFAHDVFPPAVPAGLQAVYSGEGQAPFVDLIWAPVTNADLAGYNVYRHEEEGTSRKLNSELVKAPAFRDAAVVSGATYWYSVSAVDMRGNESARSEEASERVPKEGQSQ